MINSACQANYIQTVLYFSSMRRKHIAVLTGAGISAESGLKTFRDSDGLWMGYDIADVATPQAFEKDPALVLSFYNMRRKDVAAASPNAGHTALAEMEKHFDVSIITQNIDDLHERAGSTKVLHLHGEIFKAYPVNEPANIMEMLTDIELGDKGEDGSQLRPHIVWFGEAVPMIETAAHILSEADAFVVIGTSLQVYPAASLLHYAPQHIPRYIVDRKIPDVDDHPNLFKIELPATQGVPVLLQRLIKDL